MSGSTGGARCYVRPPLRKKCSSIYTLEKCKIFIHFRLLSLVNCEWEGVGVIIFHSTLDFKKFSRINTTKFSVMQAGHR